MIFSVQDILCVLSTSTSGTSGSLPISISSLLGWGLTTIPVDSELSMDAVTKMDLALLGFRSIDANTYCLAGDASGLHLRKRIFRAGRHLYEEDLLENTELGEDFKHFVENSQCK